MADTYAPFDFYPKRLLALGDHRPCNAVGHPSIVGRSEALSFSNHRKPIGDGPDYENIAWNLSVGRGFSFDWTDPRWKSPYQEDGADRYAAQLSRTSSHTPTTGRPPLLPWMIAAIYQIFPRGPSPLA